MRAANCGSFLCKLHYNNDKDQKSQIKLQKRFLEYISHCSFEYPLK